MTEPDPADREGVLTAGLCRHQHTITRYKVAIDHIELDGFPSGTLVVSHRECIVCGAEDAGEGGDPESESAGASPSSPRAATRPSVKITVVEDGVETVYNFGTVKQFAMTPKFKPPLPLASDSRLDSMRMALQPSTVASLDISLAPLPNKDKWVEITRRRLA